MAVAHTGSAGHKVLSVIGTGYPLYQNCHLFILFIQSPHPAVFQRGYVHGAGVYLPDRLLEGFQTLFRAALIDAENRFIFPGESVSEAVLQKTGGANDKGVLSKVFQHIHKPFPDFCREYAVEQMLPQLPRRAEVAFR